MTTTATHTAIFTIGLGYDPKPTQEGYI